MTEIDDEFKFPDEIDEKDDKSVEIEAQGDDVTIEIEDDTPPEDRNVEPLPDDKRLWLWRKRYWMTINV